MDLVLRDAGGDHIVLDLKWGANRYRDLLRLGNAVQLAIYAAVKRLVMGIPELPTAAYFSLSKGELLATDVSRFATGRAVDGPGLSDTWSRLERTVDEVERALARGEIPVTGVRQALPLLDAVNVPEPERGRYLDLGKEAACTYCRHPSLCSPSITWSFSDSGPYNVTLTRATIDISESPWGSMKRWRAPGHVSPWRSSAAR